MQITLDNKDSGNAALKVSIAKEDYQSNIDKKVKDYGKSAKLKGFRQGKVPVSIIKKMIGKRLLIDEINNLVRESVSNYLKENKIKLIGEPLPDNDKNNNIDWENQNEFEFKYDIGITPDFICDISKKLRLNRYKIKITDKTVNDAIDDLVKKIGSKNKKSSPSLDQQFFDKVFGEGVVRSKEEFTEKLKETIAHNYEKESDNFLLKEIRDMILLNTKMDLPMDFLNKWFSVSNNGDLTKKQFVTVFDDYVQELKWSLIQNKIADDNKIKVTNEEILQMATLIVRSRYANLEMNQQTEENINAFANNYLKENDGRNYQNLYQQLFFQKTTKFIKENITIKEKKVDIEEFKKLAVE
ncbi:MAG: hypothetical protein FVQ77_03000 [Cytophagales bacterium]|nr:hypothetical protein [Cytophagales bacterium]